MRLVFVLLEAKLRIAGHQIASVRNESRLKVSVVSAAAVLLWIAAFYAFYRGFMWLKAFGIDPTGEALGLGDIIMARLLAVFALALFFMLGFSNVLISFSTLYRSQEMAYLVQSPLPIRSLFIARFVECVVFSSWASAYIGSPLLLAYGITTGAPVPFYFASVAFYVPYVTIPAALGAIITMTLVRLFPRLPRGSMVLLASASLMLLFFYLRASFSSVRLSDETFLPTILDAMQRTQSPLLPSYWATRGILDAAQSQYAGCLFNFLLLLANALFLTLLASETAQRLFFAGWSILTDSASRRKSRVRPGLLEYADKALVIFREPARSLVMKDIRLFWRDPAQWSQFVIFFGIMALYIANLRNRWIEGEKEVYRTWVVCLNIAACTLILATLTTRFVFPLVSLEGRRFWILGLAPLTTSQIIWQKFWMSVGTTSLFTISLVVLSCMRLRVDTIPFALAVYSIIVTNFALSGLAVGLGALYPNFREENPARIVSGMGGTLNLLLSMGYLAFVVGAQTLILLWRVLGRFTRPETFSHALVVTVVFITLLSGLAMTIPMALGLRNLKHAEF